MSEPTSFLFDFGDDPLGEAPSYLSFPWTQTTVEVRESAWAENGRALVIHPYGSNGFFAAVFDTLPAARDYEVRGRVRESSGVRSGSHWLTGVQARIQGNLAGRTSVFSSWRLPNSGNDRIVVGTLNSGTHTPTYGSMPTDWPERQFRVRFEGGVIYTKVWRDGDLEPGDWTTIAEPVAPTMSEDHKPGLFRFHGRPTSEIDWLEFTPLGLEPDPDPDPDPGELLARYDARTLATDLDDGDPVQTWHDLVLDGHDATQSSIALRPTFDVDAFGPDRPGVVFDDDLLDATLDVATPATVVAVVRPGNPGRWLSSTGGTARMTCYVFSGELRIHFGDGNLSGRAVPADTPMLVTSTFGGADGPSTIRRDRVQVASGTGSAFVTTGLRLGNDASGQGGRVTIAELRVYAGILDGTDLDQIEAELYDAWLADPDPDPDPPVDVRIMPVGDSITAGSSNATFPQATWRLPLCDRLDAAGVDYAMSGPYATHPSGHGYVRQGEWDHRSYAVSGWRTANVRDGMTAALTGHPADVLIINIGTNDLNNNITPETARDRLADAIGRARAVRPDVKILVCEVTPQNRSGNSLVPGYNALLRDLAADLDTEQSPVRTVDLYTGWSVAEHHYDGLHPNEAGEAFIAERVWMGLEELDVVSIPSGGSVARTGVGGSGGGSKLTSAGSVARTATGVAGAGLKRALAGSVAITSVLARGAGERHEPDPPPDPPPVGQELGYLDGQLVPLPRELIYLDGQLHPEPG